MDTLNFDAIPDYTCDYISSATLRAVKRFLATDAGKAMKDEIDKEKRKEAM